MVVWPLDDPNATLVWNVVTWNNPVCVDDGAAKKEVPPEQQQPGGPADPWDLDSCCTDGCVCSTFVVLLHQTVRHVRREIFFFFALPSLAIESHCKTADPGDTGRWSVVCCRG